MTDKLKPEKVFVLYEGRAKFGCTDDAIVLVSCIGEEETLADSIHFQGYDAIWYEYDVTEKDELVNEKIRPELHKEKFSGRILEK